MNVFKFGGASVKDVAGMRNVADILTSYSDKMVIVISAMGKTTNAMESILRSIASKEDVRAKKEWNLLCNDHKEVASKLDATEYSIKYLDEYQEEGRSIIYDYPRGNYDELYDQLVSLGELMSSTVFAGFLLSQGVSAKWLDARKMIKTDARYRSANVLWRETEQATREAVDKHSERHQFLITQGFIARTQEGLATTLGREGSDYTAAIISYCIDAESMSIWKDVPGVLTADPRIFPEATLVERMSYREAIEMTYYGAQVIHPKTIQPIQRKGIPLHVKSFVDRATVGTVIDDQGSEHYPPMIVVTTDQYLLRFSTKDFSFIAEKHLSMLFRKFNHYRIRINLMRNTAISFTVCASAEADRLLHLKEELMYEFGIEQQDNMKLITVRHYTDEVIQELKAEHEVLFEEIQGVTFQMVVKEG